MGRRDYPDAEKIAERAQEKKKKGGLQRTLDDKEINQYHQQHVIEAQKKNDKAIGTGIVGVMVDSRVNIMGSRPRAKVMARGGQDAEKHASDTLEPWANIMPWQAQGDFDVWDTGLQDHQMVGEAWSKVLAAPQFYADSGYMELIEEWNRLVNDGKDTKDVHERVKLYRRDNPAIVWRYVDPRDVYPDPDERGMAEVYEFRKMSKADIESRFGGLPEDTKDEEIEVIEYANEVWVATILPGGGGIMGIGKRDAKFLGEPWEHGEGCNPYVCIKRGPMRANPQGYTRRGCSYHAREMVQSLDESLTDFRGTMRREAESPPMATLIPALRVRYGLDAATIDVPSVSDNKALVLLSGEEGEEKMGRYPVAEVNPQYPTYFGMVAAYADRAGADRPQLMGEGPSGQSAVHQDISRQSALTSELEVSHRNLEQGFAEVVKRCFRCVVALDRTLPEGADAEMRKVVVRDADGKHGSREIAVTADDVRDYDPLVRAKLTKNLTAHRSLAIQNALLLSDDTGGKKPLADRNTVRETELNWENPQEIDDKIQEQSIVDDIILAYREGLKQRVTVRIDELSDEDMAKIAKEMQEMSPAAAQALIAELSGEQAENAMMGDLARGQANVARTGREQRMSRLSGMGMRPVEEVQ